MSWLITSAGAILLALVFARLAAEIPKAGRLAYAYTLVAFGDFAGCLIAWGYWIGLWASVAPGPWLLLATLVY